MAPNAAQFIGRADEMQVLERAFATAAAGVTTTVLIGGDPGIGKSTLLAEAASRFAGRSLVASCVRMGGTQIPLAPVATLLRRLQRSDAELLATVPLLADWIRPGSATPIGHHDVLAATADLVTAAAEASTPLLFAVEDVHWADGATWDLVEYLARGLVDVPVVVAATYRTADADSEVELRRRIAELSRLPQASRVVLSGWSAAEVADRVEILLGAPPPLGLVSEVVSRGQGNPFFTEELVAARSAGHELPPVVADLISADLARLDDPARAVVGALAVLGRPARHDVLVAVAGLGDDAEPAIRTAVEAGIVHVADELYAVRHALISEVAYRSMLPGERRRRHRLAAEALRGGRGTQIDHVGELAVHLDRAGDLDAAFVALLEAADASEKVAPGAALEHLQRAIALWDDVPDVAQHDNLAHRLWQAAELASATRGNEAAVELAQRALTIGPPARGWAFGHERLGRYLWSTGRLEASTVEFERAHELVGSSTDPAELAPVFAGLGQAELMRGNYDAAEEYAQRALDVLDDPSLEPMAWVMSNRVLGLVVSHRGEPERGTTLCRRALEAATSAQMRGLARIYYVQALLGAGRYDDAANTALDASADAVQSGIGYSFAGYLDALASEALIRLGRWSEAARLLARHDDEPKLPIGEMRLAIANAKLAVRMGDAEGAHRWLDAARQYPIDLWHESYRTAAIADVELVSRRWAEAAVAARRGLES
ncbi:MAG: AAA family ATPase, partial [Candidatus Nanopelagicales bacterium]